MSALAGQTVVIVGASSGIGLATARAAASEGAMVLMISRSREKLEAAAQTVAGNVTLAAADMLDASAIRAAIASAGAIDHLVLTAVADEIPRIAPLSQLSLDQMDGSMGKLRGYFLATQAAASAMRERGSITMTSGASRLKPTLGMSVLGAVAAAVTTFARTLALELAPVRVNSVTPGVVDTPIHAGARHEGVRTWAESTLLARRFGKPEDIAHAILFLMVNPYMTGHDLVIDGGLSVM